MNEKKKLFSTYAAQVGLVAGVVGEPLRVEDVVHGDLRQREREGFFVFRREDFYFGKR